MGEELGAAGTKAWHGGHVGRWGERWVRQGLCPSGPQLQGHETQERLWRACETWLLGTSRSWASRRGRLQEMRRSVGARDCPVVWLWADGGHRCAQRGYQAVKLRVLAALLATRGGARCCRRNQYSSNCLVTHQKARGKERGLGEGTAVALFNCLVTHNEARGKEWAAALFTFTAPAATMGS